MMGLWWVSSRCTLHASIQASASLPSCFTRVLTTPSNKCSSGGGYTSKNKVLFSPASKEIILPLYHTYEFELLQSGELRKACSKRGYWAQPPDRVNSTLRLKNLREKMKSEIALQTVPIQAYFVTSMDEHQSSEIEDYEKRRQYISGFSGSYGDAIITMDQAALWTDGRYHLQADEQIDCNWLLFREGLRNVPNIPTRSKWLKSKFPDGARIGVNPKLISEYQWQKLTQEFQGSKLQLIALNVSLIDMIWPENERTRKKAKDAFVLDIIYSGKNYTTKLQEVRQRVLHEGAEAMIVTSLAEVAWLLNIRGRDVPLFPFVRSYVFFDMNSIWLYINETQLEGNQLMSYLHTQPKFKERYTVQLKEYSDIWGDLRTKSQLYRKILVPSHFVYSEGASHAIYEHITESKRLPRPSPIIYLKAVKNAAEIEGMKNASIKDGAAICDCFAYVEKRLSFHDNFTEEKFANYLDEFRFEQVLSLGNSFNTIVAFGAHGAFPRYIPTKNTNADIFDNSTIVIESGGQFYEGTTTVTRTLHYGTPTEEMIDAYTRVLIGNIRFAMLSFPSDMKMADVDVIVRQPLWQVGLDYNHATGHGIGSFLGVRESPIIIQYDSEISASQTFQPGYFLTSEPGYYKEGHFGVRLQNVFQVIEKPWLQQPLGPKFLGFQIVSLVPFEIKLINFRMLNREQKKWLNWYNAQIRTNVGPELKAQNRQDGFYWMVENTEYIPETDSAVITRPKLLLLANFVIIVTISF